MSKPSRLDRLSALERGDAAALGVSPEHLERARALLSSDDPSGAEALPEPLLELVAFHAAEHGRAAFLARAGAGPKVLARAAKKELYRLKSEGRPLELPEVRAETPAPRAEEPRAAPTAFLSPVDIDGHRTFIAPAEHVRHGFGAYLGELSDAGGVVRVDFAPMPRREYRKFSRELARPTGGEPPWLELPVEKLGAYVDAAVALNRAKDTLSEPVLQLSRALPGQARPAESRSWPAADAHQERARVHDGPRLFAWVENARWMPTNEGLALLAQRLDEVATSRLVVDEGQRRAQMEAALDRTVAELFTPEARALWAERLFQQADYFGATGRREPAELCAATARALAGDMPVAEIPFARALFQKALFEQTEAALAQMPPEQRERFLREEQAQAKSPPADSPLGLILPGR